eukprot:SAG31_NODE_17057_length_685_cov_0.788396_2_plen_60_part_01
MSTSEWVGGTAVASQWAAAGKFRWCMGPAKDLAIPNPVADRDSSQPDMVAHIDDPLSAVT